MATFHDIELTDEPEDQEPNKASNEENPFPDSFSPSDVVNKDDVDPDDPFATEFDKQDVANKKDEGYKVPDLSEEDIDQIVNYDESRRMNLGFEDDFDSEDPLKDLVSKDKIEEEDLLNILNRVEADRIQKAFKEEIDGETEDQKIRLDYLNANFKDYIVAPGISGTYDKFPDSNILPNDIINERKNTIEIIDTPEKKHDKHSQSSVVINRDDMGELESIEVYCKCGERTVITFDYEDEEELETEIVKDLHDIQPLIDQDQQQNVFPELEIEKNEHAENSSSPTSNEENKDNDEESDQKDDSSLIELI